VVGEDALETDGLMESFDGGDRAGGEVGDVLLRDIIGMKDKGAILTLRSELSSISADTMLELLCDLYSSIVGLAITSAWQYPSSQAT
jgi:hypothetical protein